MVTSCFSANRYVPYVGDSKRAMDEYTSEIFMGGKVGYSSSLDPVAWLISPECVSC
jgi:myo-inositol-1-phosphate synthase